MKRIKINSFPYTENCCRVLEPLNDRTNIRRGGGGLLIIPELNQLNNKAYGDVKNHYGKKPSPTHFYFSITFPRKG